MGGIRDTGGVAVVGLGAIGSGVAGALVAAGHATAVYDVRAQAVQAFADRAKAAGSVEEAAAEARVLVLAVVDDAQVTAVLDAALPVLPRGAVVLVLSTISVATLTACAERADALGVHVVDCGVTGGPQAAADGRLVAMLGGDADAVDAVVPVVEAFAGTVVRMGGRGAGMRAKLVRNQMQYGIWAVAAEAERLAVAAGVDVEALKTVVRAGDVLTGGPTTLMGVDLPPEAQRGTAALAHKDLRAALDLAEAVGADVPLTAAIEPTYDRVLGMETPAKPAPAAETVRERGLRRMSEVYNLPMDLSGATSPYVDVTIEHLFGDIWSRPALDTRERRLLTIGVIAALGKDDLMELQLSSALARGELTPEQLRETIVHLAHYAGWPLTANLGGIVERLIRKHEAATGKAADRAAGDA
ncbi:MAG: NAD-binding protein [Streptomycetaceae bacterium]|nr:NAD-binding protein [Streptomycetaceae bacterium]